MITVLAAPANSGGQNPYIDQLYKNMENVKVAPFSYRRALLSNYNIIHFHWPDNMTSQPSFIGSGLRCLALVAIILKAKITHTKIIRTVHNLLPHDMYHPRLSRVFLTWFNKQCDGLIFLSHSSEEAFQKAFPHCTAKTTVIHHGHYRDIYPPLENATDAKKKLGLSTQKKTFLFLGAIRPYKNVPHLIRTFKELNDPQSQLVIAGKAPSSEEHIIREEAKGNKDIHLHLHFIKDSDLGTYFSAADTVVLPYRQILNSGSAILALSYNRPVIVPALGSLKELAQQVPGWLTLFENNLKKEDLKNVNVIQHEMTCNLKALEWKPLSKQTTDFYRNI